MTNKINKVQNLSTPNVNFVNIFKSENIALFVKDFSNLNVYFCRL